MNIQPFKIDIPQAILDDLYERLAQTRFPAEVEGVGWDYGTNVSYMKTFTDYWRNSYDWRKHEAELNKLPHFRADIDGVGIHFIHVRGKGDNPTPIILTHGWPDSFYRFHKVIPMLTDPASFGGDPSISFDVVIPSIPGFGFSDRKPMSEEKVADLWVKLMKALGYERFAAAGGDVGAIVTKSLGFKYPENVIAVHLTDVGYPTGQEDFSTMSPPELEFAGFIQNWWMQNGAYAMIQMTKPQTLAYGLNDSPVAWAAWSMTLMSDPTGERFSMDELLTNIMIYWTTETIASSVRSYYEGAQAEPLIKPGERVGVPSAVAHCPLDAPLPREWAARQVNLKHFTDFPRGGHFVALEEPKLYAEDLQSFFRLLRDTAE
jgi:epoxide hydrolase